MAQEQPVLSAELKSVVRNEAPWKAKISRLGEDKDFIAVQTLKTSGVWIADAHGRLYKTNNHGEWLPLSIDVPEDSQITGIDFADPLLGWAVSTRTPPDVLDSQGFESSILKTNDGGLHWQAQFTGKAMNLVRVVFVNDQEGWAVGSKLVQRATLERDYVVLHTTDQGEHWADVSGGLNRDGAGGVVEDIYSVQSSRAVILTADREILSTEDGGDSWRTQGSVQDEPPQTSTFRLGILQNNSIWVLGATGAREGTWSMLAVRRDSDHWMKYRSYDVLLSDAIFLSDLEVVACGTMPSNNKVPLLADDHRAGVILRSSDGGLNWTVIYRDPKAKSINAITAEQGGYIWAVGEGGLVVRLDPVLGSG